MTQFYRSILFLMVTLFIGYSYSQEMISDKSYAAHLSEIRKLSSNNPTKAIYELENMLISFTLTHEQMIETYYRLSNVAYSADDNEKTIRYADLSLNLIGKNDHREFADELLYNKAYAMNVLMLDGVEETAKKSITLAQSYGDVETLISSYQILGEYYLKVSKFTQAHMFINESIKLAIQIDNELLLANGYALHGTIYKETSEYANSLEALKKSLKLYEKFNHKHNIFTMQLFIAEILAEQERYEQSEVYYNNVIANSASYTQFYFQARVGLSSLKIKEKEYEQAMIHIDEIELALPSVEDLNTKIRWYLNKIEILTHLTRLDEAKYLIENIVESNFFPIGKLTGPHKVKFQLLKSNYYELSNDHRTALNLYKNFHKLDVANLQSKSNAVFRDIREKYQSDKKDEQLTDMEFNLKINQLELERKEQESRYQQIIIFTSVFVVLIILYALIKQTLLKKKLSQMVHTDALTNVSNRYSLIKNGNHVFENRVQENKDLSVILLDIDNFKSINDTFGHSKGDDVLKIIAKIGRMGTRENDWFGRLGGEEFVSILSNTNERDASNRAETIRQAIYEYNWKKLGLDYQISASIGVANVSFIEGEKTITSFNALLNCADKAMYSAKNTGKNRVVLYSSLANC